MKSAWIETLEGRQLMSAAPMAPVQARAGAMIAAGDVVQQRDQDRLQDGSCKTTATTVSATATADKVQQRDRLHDGSCKA